MQYMLKTAYVRGNFIFTKYEMLRDLADPFYAAY